MFPNFRIIANINIFIETESLDFVARMGNTREALGLNLGLETSCPD